MDKKINPIGAHYSIKDGYLGAFKMALEDGADALQIFAKSPASARLRAVTEEESKEVLNWENRDKIKSLVIHASYLINLASDKYEDGSYQIKSIVEDIKNAEKLGGQGAVVHCGKQLKLTKEEAVNNFVHNIKLIADKTKELGAKLFIENTAGQGTEMGFTLEELSDIYKKIDDTKRVQICLDTAHAFGAGYDIANNPKDVVDKLGKLIGIKNIGCIHLNDSKKPLNSHVDRHADLGAGEIGLAGLTTFAKEIQKVGGEHIPLILEVPQEASDYKSQIKKLRGTK
jgi:deoxyribonuclease-4